jgi:hypothetical protein
MDNPSPVAVILYGVHFTANYKPTHECLFRAYSLQTNQHFTHRPSRYEEEFGNTVFITSKNYAATMPKPHRGEQEKVS